MELIDIEQKKLAILLNDREQEEKEWLEETGRIRESEKADADAVKEQQFLDDRRRQNMADKSEHRTTNELAKELKDNFTQENLTNLLTNYQGKKS